MNEIISENINTFEDIIKIISEILKGSSVSEPRLLGGSLTDFNIDEHFLQNVWFDRHIQEDNLKTLSDKELQIINPGRWNKSGGPDFLGAEIMINNTIVKGDVEIHLISSDWVNHGHNTNPQYNDVILHAFLKSGNNEIYETNYLSNKIECFELEDYIFPDIQTLKKIISVEDFSYESNTTAGRCAKLLVNQSVDFVLKFLDLAGNERIEQKVARFKNQLRGVSFNQVFYQALMTTMGHKSSKPLFFLLSKRSPVDELLDYTQQYQGQQKIEAIESILLNTANLVPPRDEFDEHFDEETMNYINTLNRYWAEFSGFFNDRIIPHTKNWMANVRPVNFPQRRIAGISHLIVKYSDEYFLSKFVNIFKSNIHIGDNKDHIKKFIKNIQQLLVVDEQDFWTHRFSFGTKKSAQSMKLIGESTALSIMFNSLIPIVILKARETQDEQLEQFCFTVLKYFPKLPENEITKFMTHRIFESNEKIINLIKSEKQQQAFFHIFNQCCGNNAVTCDKCVYIN